MKGLFLPVCAHRVISKTYLHNGDANATARVLVRVQDEGPGIAAPDLPHLFDRLYQSRTGVAPATSDEGKGLGLAIVKRIAELHQGSVTVDCPPLGGTLVTLQFPGS